MIAVLLLLSVLLTMGLALQASQVERYRGASSATQRAVALSLAEAGLEDARVKLEKDPLFPPPGTTEQEQFTYSEDLDEQGSYTVTIDRTYAGAPHRILLLRSVGCAGKRGSPLARHALIAELDLRGPRSVNAEYFTIRTVRGEDLP